MSTEAGAVHAHPSDAVGARIGMWLFLLTEMVLFGGLFLLYAVYRAKFAADFHFCTLQLDTVLGTVNTVILLTSSLTMVLAVGALERDRSRLSAFFTGLTILLAVVFLVNKYFEWSGKIHHGIWPNSPELTGHTPGENLFFGLYYAMTGLHGIHVLAGVGVLAVMLRKVMRGTTAPARLLIQMENAGLYWHLVDIIWIFLFPLFYLIS